ncbi:MAG TPA: hypothetical protein VIP11_15165 [Gemmatimonadaceae bacterium]
MNKLVPFSMLILGFNGCFARSLVAMQIAAKAFPPIVAVGNPVMPDSANSVTAGRLVNRIQIHQPNVSPVLYHRPAWPKRETTAIARDSGRTVVVSTAIGAIAGAVVGGTIGRKFATGNCELTYPPCDNATRGTIVGAGLGAITGGVIGYLIGVILQDR